MVDFGAQYAQLIARRVREAHVYSEIVPHSMPVAEMLAKNPAAIILSGGPSSVYAAGRPAGRRRRCSTPACRCSASATASRRWPRRSAATVARTGRREYGGTPLTVADDRRRAAARTCRRDQPVWMSHGDCVTEAPAGLHRHRRARAGAPVAAFEDLAGRRAGVQFHPEVAHTAHGQEVLRRFLYDIAGIEPDLDPREHHRRAGRPRSGRRSATRR